MTKNIFWLLTAAVLGISFVACSNDSNEVIPDIPTPEDSLGNENSSLNIEFKTSVINNSPFCEINEENMDMIAVMGTGHAVTYSYGKETVNANLLGFIVDYNDYYNQFVYGGSHQKGFIYLQRNADDPTVWDYRMQNTNYFENRWFNWDQLWNPRAPIFPGGGATHATFIAFHSPTVKRNYLRPETNLQVNGETTNSGGYFRMQLSRKFEKDDDLNRELYYRSDLLRDLVIAEARVPVPVQYEYLIGKPLPTVELKFIHPLARLELRGIVEDDDAIEVTVGYAAIAGIGLEAKYYPSWFDFKEHWQVQNYSWSSYQQWIEMALDNPVRLNSKESKPLQNKGAEPWVFPQTIEKGWTNKAMDDGAGIMLGVTMKNKYDGSYIIGSDKGYEKVYMPLEPMTLESENNYVIEVNFGCQYDVNGNPKGYHISYQPQIQKWATSEKEVDMVKKN